VLIEPPKSPSISVVLSEIPLYPSAKMRVGQAFVKGENDAPTLRHKGSNFCRFNKVGKLCLQFFHFALLTSPLIIIFSPQGRRKDNPPHLLSSPHRGEARP